MAKASSLISQQQGRATQDGWEQADSLNECISGKLADDLRTVYTDQQLININTNKQFQWHLTMIQFGKYFKH